MINFQFKNSFIETLYFPISEAPSILTDLPEKIFDYVFPTNSFYTVSPTPDIDIHLSYVYFGILDQVNTFATSIYRSFTSKHYDSVLYGPALITGSNISSVNQKHKDNIMLYVSRFVDA